IPAGTYQVAVTADLYLRTMQTMTMAEGANSADFGEQRGGDANDTNSVTATDFSTLATAFNTAPSDQNFNANADFNGDGIVNALDFSLLASNFNTSGEVPSDQTAP
ncbi:MAG: dockerin type I domain-containing protein, partial [Chloroflexota bacterium]